LNIRHAGLLRSQIVAALLSGAKSSPLATGDDNASAIAPLAPSSDPLDASSAAAAESSSPQAVAAATPAATVETGVLASRSLLLEVVSRSARSLLRQLQRDRVEKHRFVSEERMRTIIVQFLNLITGQAYHRLLAIALSS
jgi:hypothetical protein